MTKNSSNQYLHDCLDQFPTVSTKLFGIGPEMKAIEHAAKELCKTVRIEDMFHHFQRYEHKSWFRPYWLFPSLDNLTSEEKKIPFNFHSWSRKDEGKTKEKIVIEKLLKAFRQIELVSVMLRFICPQSFGMLTPPVMAILGLYSSANAVQTYLNYLGNLRAIRDHCEFVSAADADMAIWVLQYKCNNEEIKDPAIKQQFEDDEFMQNLCAKNMATHLDVNISGRLAKALSDVNEPLAELVVCYVLEDVVTKWVKKENPDVQQTVKRLAGKNGIPMLCHRFKALQKAKKFPKLENVKKEFDDLREFRNEVFHAARKNINSNRLRKTIATVMQIEKALQCKP